MLAVEDSAFAFAMRFIHEHACHGITVEDVLQGIPLSRMTLERRFRKYLGRSPHAEIRAVQIARAKQLLIETEHPSTGSRSSWASATRSISTSSSNARSDPPGRLPPGGTSRGPAARQVAWRPLRRRREEACNGRGLGRQLFVVTDLPAL